MGNKCASSLEQDLERISTRINSNAPGEKRYVGCIINAGGAARVDRKGGHPRGCLAGEELVFFGADRIKIELNIRDTVANVKAQLTAQGVVSRQWNIISLDCKGETLMSHLTLEEQLGERTLDEITLVADRKYRCVQLLQGHTSSIYFVRMLSDGRVMTASEDATVRYWSEAGVAKQVIRGLLTGVGSIELLKLNGKALVTGSLDDNVARVWEAHRQWKCSHMLKGHAGAILSVKALFDGHSIATGSADNSIRIWNGSTGACLRVLNGHVGGVTCIEELDETQIVSGSFDGTARIWNTCSEECVLSLIHISEPTRLLSISYAVFCLKKKKTKLRKNHED
eukprot:TRINITY_DN6450_c0_g3_i1.p1 TRINITY_DN6450_c0_g3~~TRINITY_DN6450_c0_g3_i1.p1  ORF type:complete len:339 (-),score=53.99 TRINITY_DN6450_c0_g3_i1:38-1054(-)